LFCNDTIVTLQIRQSLCDTHFGQTRKTGKTGKTGKTDQTGKTGKTDQTDQTGKTERISKAFTFPLYLQNNIDIACSVTGHAYNEL